jgi:hypothetical protein
MFPTNIWIKSNKCRPHTPDLALAPKQTEPPFLVTQLGSPGLNVQREIY